MVASIYATQQPAFRPDLFDLYVDSVGGSDANNGNSAATPVQTLATAQTKALAKGSGVKIALKYGSAWREKLDLSTLNYVHVEGYGNTADGLPMARCDDVITGWLSSVDRGDANTLVYSKSVTWVGAANFPLAWEDGNAYTYVASVALCQATAGTFYLPTLSTTLGAPGNTQILYVHPYGDTNAQTDGKLREFTTRDYAFVAKDNCIFKHLFGYRGSGQYGALYLGDDALMESCLGAEGVRHDMLINSGRFYRCVGWITNRAYTDKISIEGFRASGAGKTVAFDTCIVVSSTGTVFPETGIGGHTGGVAFDAWTMTNCSVKGCVMGAAGNVTSLTITRAKLDHARIKHTGTGAASTLTIIDPWIVGIQTVLGASFSIQPLGCVWSIDGLRTYITESYANGLIVPQTNTNAGTLTGSVIVDALAATARRRMLYGDANTKWTSNLNVFKTTGANTAGNEPFVYWNNSGGTATHAANNNVYHATNASFGINFIVNSVTYNTVAAYFTAMRPGNDANSVNVDPAVVDPANGNFTLSGVGLPAGIGLQRDPTCQLYTPIPADLAAAKAWLLAA